MTVASPLRGARVLFVFATAELGGAERQALLLARYLREAKGAEVMVLCPGAKPGRVARMCEETRIPWKAVALDRAPGRAGTLRVVLRVARSLRREKPELVLPYHSVTNILCGVAWRLSGAKACIWNLRNAGHDLVDGRLLRLALRLTPRFLANAAHGRELLVNAFGVRQDRVAVIPNGVDLTPAVADRPEWRRRLEIPGGAVVAGMLGNLHRVKDHPTLLRAWGILARRASGEGAPPPPLLLAGRFDGQETELKALAFDLGICGTIRFLGPVDDVTGLLGACDLLVHSSRTEGLPHAVLEAMAAGLPIVATDLPGVREAVGEDGTRFLAPPGDPAALAECAWTLFRNPGLRKELGAAMQARARRCFDAPTNFERMAACLEAALTSA